jgi:hypothetical protein
MPIAIVIYIYPCIPIAKILQTKESMPINHHIMVDDALVMQPRGTFSVKFEIYVHQTTIFREILDNCSTYFYHLIIVIIIYYN